MTFKEMLATPLSMDSAAPVRLAEDSLRVRRRLVEAMHRAGGGHYGGCLSVVDVLVAIYRGVMGACAETFDDPGRDRVVLSKGHAAMALYTVLADIGILDGERLGDYGAFGKGLEGHPDMTVTRGVDFSTGSLGQGVAIGMGMAIALAARGSHVWVVVGDGECQEGEVWEAAQVAARYGVDNLHVVVDDNGAQEYGWSHRPGLPTRPMPRLVAKWSSFGWDAASVDGHDPAALVQAFRSMRLGRGRPSVAVASTVKGAGCSLFQREPERYHCARLTEEEFRRALEDLS